MSIYIEQTFETLDINFNSKIKLLRHANHSDINLDELISHFL